MAKEKRKRRAKLHSVDWLLVVIYLMMLLMISLIIIALGHYAPDTLFFVVSFVVSVLVTNYIILHIVNRNDER